MVTEPKEGRRVSGGAALTIAGLGVSLATLISVLLRPSRAAGATPEEPMNVIVDGDVRQALAALLLQGEDVKNSLKVTNSYLLDILSALGGVPAGGKNIILQPFQEKNKTLTSGQSLTILEGKNLKGGLIWAVVDVTDPDTAITFQFDELKWDFEYNTLYNEGVDRPLFPGVWLSKYDIANSHYALVFSAGSLNGFSFNNRISVLARFKGSGTATLTEGRGIYWEEI